MSAPSWLESFRLNATSRRQIVVTGNVRDLCLPRAGAAPSVAVPEALISALLESGRHAVVLVDPVAGLCIRRSTADDQGLKAIAQALAPRELPRPGEWLNIEEEDLLTSISALLSLKDASVALVIDYAARLFPTPQRPERNEWQLLVSVERHVHTAGPGVLAVWIAEREEELPELLLMEHPGSTKVHVPLPSADERQRQAVALSRGDKAHAHSLSSLTDDLPLRALFTVNRLAQELGHARPDIDRAVNLFKYGLHDNPWQQGAVMEKIMTAESALKSSVKGQNQAIQQTVARLKRSVMGMSGAQGSATSRRPRAVMMLAGPTGVGKTELVRSLTRHLFGSEDMYTRFDMSEFSASHAEQRLIGAPPSYVGFEQGGELTNAVRRKPFSVLLFDEIDKAHPLILDKFLQILEDGRLTDGRGHTVYFSECLMFFTTNLGIYRRKANPVSAAPERELAVPYGAAYEDLHRAVREGISHEFRSVIGRPELENRLGENIIVFDFIRNDVVWEILKGMLASVAERARKQNFELKIAEPAVRSLLAAATKACATFGGRGIGNVVDQQLINPLSAVMFDLSVAGRRGAINVAGIVPPATSGAPFTLQLK